jgi:epoxyqueuosine reductase
MSLAQVIKDEARRLGFDLVGITTPDPPAHFSNYEAWLDADLHGEMSYLATDRARSRRANPRAVLEECRSILMLGASYRSPTISPGTTHQAPALKPTARNVANGKAPGGKVAAYAWNPDYHDVFPPRFKALVTFIEAQVGHPVAHRWYTDTGPLLERDLAQRAGLGWIGKNTCLIAPGLGSYFLLAEILLDLDLEPDPPFQADRCGSCTRCLRACPTGCILADRTMDARRCISYLTIELKGAIPPDLRSMMGEWVFGCDVCQQVCPWNRFAAAHSGVGDIDLLADFSLTPEEFNRRFRGTPRMRAKRRGYLRNVAVALGNAREVVAIPMLVQALLYEPESLVRGHAAWALGQMGGEAAHSLAAQEALKEAACTEMDPLVRAEIQAALDTM